jgi:S-phase kinase-associated protein 1
VSKDDKKFEFPVGLTEQSSFIKEQIEGLTDTTREVFEIPVNQFNGHVVEKCLEFMIHHDKVPITMPAKPLQRKLEDYFSNSFDRDYFAELDSEPKLLIDMIMCCNFIGNSSLLELCCAKVASCAKGKTPSQIRATFGIDNDFTKEEEERVNEELAWIEEADNLEK